MAVSFSSGCVGGVGLVVVRFVSLRVWAALMVIVVMLCVTYWWFILLLVGFLLVFWVRVLSCRLVGFWCWFCGCCYLCLYLLGLVMGWLAC